MNNTELGDNSGLGQNMLDGSNETAVSNFKANVLKLDILTSSVGPLSRTYHYLFEDQGSCMFILFQDVNYYVPKDLSGV